MKASESAIQPFLERLMCRSSLDNDDQQKVLSLPAQIILVESNKDLIPDKEFTSHSCLVVSGISARYVQSKEGHRQIAALHIRGDMPDLSSLLLPHRSSGLQTITPSTIAFIPHNALHELTKSPAIAEAFWRDTMVDAAISTQWIVNLGQRDAPARIAHLICELATRYQKSHDGNEFEFALPLTQQHIADAVGISVVHANRAVQMLKNHGLMLIANRQVQVLDWRLLCRAADFDPTYLYLSCTSSGQ